MLIPISQGKTLLSLLLKGLKTIIKNMKQMQLRKLNKSVNKSMISSKKLSSTLIILNFSLKARLL